MRRTSDFDYVLPPELIAQDPPSDRAASRLLVLDPAGSGVRHARFPDFVDLVAPEDVLVLNVSRVIPARLHGKREMGKIAELLLVRELPDGSWLAMGHPGGKLKPGRRVTFGDDSAVEIVGRMGGGLRHVRFVGALDARATLTKYGEVPLPPYIRRPPRPEDRERYQTVYATHDGSVAAPTAGLHFTSELLARIRAKGVAVAEVDLHVGPGERRCEPPHGLRGLRRERSGRGGHQRSAAGRRARLGGRDHGRTHPGDVRRRAQHDHPGSRANAPVHPSAVRVPSRRSPAHELSPATLDAANVGVRVWGL